MAAVTQDTAETTNAESTDVETTGTEAGAEKYRLSLDVDIQSTGPCQRHVRVIVPRKDLDHFREEAVAEFAETATIPGFRAGRVPTALVEKRFRKELTDQLRQRVLLQSLDQLSEDNRFDPINEPDFDVEGLVIPDEGDFQYEFDVEVRPEFDLPTYTGLKIQRSNRVITDEQVVAHRDRYLAQYGDLTDTDAPAEVGNYLTLTIAFSDNDKPLRRLTDVSVELKPTLQFPDGQISGFDQLMAGTVPGDTRQTTVTITGEAETVEMRGEVVQVEITVTQVQRLQMPELTKEFLSNLGLESVEDLDLQIRNMLERQVQYDQRQSTRRQILEKITESANWDLPERLVRKQVDNALRREILEMQQAGFTTQQIRARENELRQKSLSSTRQALKEHFILDRIATQENIEVTPPDIDSEIYMMAIQRGENPRRVRARLHKSGMIENLEAQIRERKAVDYLLKHAEFEDVEAPAVDESQVSALSQSICGMQAAVEEEEHDHDHDGGDHDHDHDHA